MIVVGIDVASKKHDYMIQSSNGSTFSKRSITIPNSVEGIKKLHEAHPDVDIYIGHIDRELNENAYICPGLGDAGDRIFGTL